MFPPDGLDLEAETVFQFTYDIDTFMRDDAGNLDTWSDLKLACWSLHADGAYSEGATDYLTRRFLEDPDTWFDALSVFPDSPWEHADIVVAAPVNDTYAWYGQGGAGPADRDPGHLPAGKTTPSRPCWTP